MHRVLLSFALLCALAPSRAPAAPIWGRLANPGFVNQRIKATYFFSGDAQEGPGNNTDKYTRHPDNDIHLHWSENDNKYLVMDAMVRAGINVIHMSTWGDDVDAGVAAGAPMQTTRQSHDELFDAVGDRPLLIVPFLEELYGDLDDPKSLRHWAFKDEFPKDLHGKWAPRTIAQIEYLIFRYLLHSDPSHQNPKWKDHWARVYNRDGEERYAIGIIHAASNRPSEGDDNAAFAEGLDVIAAQVFHDTGIEVGFFLDALPWGPDDLLPGSHALYLPTSDGTGPSLLKSASMLGIAGFAPEVYLNSGVEAKVVDWKRGWSAAWFRSGVPFLMDVSSGYDGTLVFGDKWSYGEKRSWLCSLDQMVRDFGESGIVFNSWNGYTEAMVAVPTKENGSMFYDWLTSLLVADVYAQKPDASPQRNGTWCGPYTLKEAIQNVPSGGTIGLLPTNTTPFDTPITITKPLTLVAVGGSATIGH